MSFNTITSFEDIVASYFGAKYGVAVDSCTHGLELCLRYTKADKMQSPRRTYISVPFLADKLSIDLEWIDCTWSDYYYITTDIIDAAVLWGENTYVPNTLMCISFQYRKHLSLGRGGMILTDNIDQAVALKKMSYDGRLPDVPWREQNIDTMGYHYYMTPETAAEGIYKFAEAVETIPHQWDINDWPDISLMDVFNN